MTTNLKICQLSPDLKSLLVKFRFRKEKTLAAIIMKINKNTLMIEADETFEDTTIEDLVDEIPHQQPRYVALSYPYNHDDGRVSFPLFFVFISPQGCSPELQMMYAGSKKVVVAEGGFTKEVEYRNLDEFTDEALQDRLKRMY